MALTPIRIGNVTLGTTATTIDTVPTNTRRVYQRLVLCNRTAGSVKVTLHLVPNGGSVGNDNMLVDGDGTVLSAGETWAVPYVEGLTERAGATLVGICDTADAVSANGSALDFT